MEVRDSHPFRVRKLNQEEPFCVQRKKELIARFAANSLRGRTISQSPESKGKTEVLPVISPPNSYVQGKAFKFEV